jgi:LysR family cys regulon transcriptional activator
MMKAASVLCTSQSGISKQISLLENELGVALFERNGRKLTTITPAGKRVLDLAKEVLTKVDDIKLTGPRILRPVMFCQLLLSAFYLCIRT